MPKKNSFFQNPAPVDDVVSDGYGTEEQEEEVVEEVAAAEEPYYEEDDEEGEPMSEVEVRLSMSQYYKLILQGDLFSGVENDPVAEAVEKEFQDFARERLEILLGMRAPKAKVVAQELPFSSSEIEVLRTIAQGVLRKQGSPPPPAQPAVVKAEVPKPQLPAVRQIAVQAPRMVAKPRPVQAAVKEEPVVPVIHRRGRGRPKGAKDTKPRQRRKDEVPEPEERPSSPLAEELQSRGFQAPKFVPKEQGRHHFQVQSQHVRPIPMPNIDQVNSFETMRSASPMISGSFLGSK